MTDPPAPPAVPPGWYPNGDVQRYWDGRAWTAHTAPLAGPPVAPAPAAIAAQPVEIAVEGLLGSVSFDGAFVTIAKKGHGAAMHGARRIPVHQITSIRGKPGTTLMHGYIQFTIAGAPSASVQVGGLASGRPDRTDPDSLSYSKAKNADFARLQAAIEQAIATR